MRCSTHSPFSSRFLPRRSPLLVLLGLVTASSILAAMTGCARLLDIEDLPDSKDGGVPPDAEPLDPGEFGITGVMPSAVLEGEGAAWPVPVVVTGQEFTSDARVVLNGAGFSQQEITPVVAADGRSLAFPLSVPVLTDTGRGDTATITVTVRQGALTAATQVAVTGLEELVTSELDSTTLEASSFDPLYSRIVIDEAITLAGSEPIRLVATSEIRLQAIVHANGLDAAGETPGVGGPGGCAGGALQADGQCGAGGGRGNPRDDGAGGGGHLTAGTPGSGDPPAPGGLETGRPDLVPLESEAGSGGGGSSLGGGGGGGGIVELTSRGTFLVSAGSISADGGRGGQGRCDLSVSLGSGGGGSGGAILIRAWGGFDDDVNQPRLTVSGGAGGDMPPDNNCSDVGGAGAYGRVRVDTPEPGVLPGFARVTPEPFQGPLFRSIDSGGAPVPVVTRQQQITLEAVGARGTGFTLDVNGTRQTFSTSSDGTARVTFLLAPGRNQVCAKTSEGVPLDVSEGVQCISIVSIQ